MSVVDCCKNFDSQDIVNCSFIDVDKDVFCSCPSSLSSVCNSSTEEYSYRCNKKKRDYIHPDACIFKSIITPLSELTPINSSTQGPIEFRMRRKNKVVSLQWQPFSGVITTTGISYLSLAQTICNMPPYSVYGIYNLEYNGVLRQAPIEINPQNIKSNVLFYLNSNGTSENVNANDSVIVKGGYISWIVC